MVDSNKRRIPSRPREALKTLKNLHTPYSILNAAHSHGKNKVCTKACTEPPERADPQRAPAALIHAPMQIPNARNAFRLMASVSR